MDMYHENHAQKSSVWVSVYLWAIRCYILLLTERSDCLWFTPDFQAWQVLLLSDPCFLISQCMLLNPEAAIGGVLKKKLFLKLSQYSQENSCVGIFFNKVSGLQAFNFIKKRLQHWCISVNIAKFLRKPILKNICNPDHENYHKISILCIFSSKFVQGTMIPRFCDFRFVSF